MLRPLYRTWKGLDGFGRPRLRRLDAPQNGVLHRPDVVLRKAHDARNVHHQVVRREFNPVPGGAFTKEFYPLGVNFALDAEGDELRQKQIAEFRVILVEFGSLTFLPSP